MIDDHDAPAQFLDIVEIVCRQQHRRAKFAIDRTQELANMILGDHVEADRRLIKKKQRRIVQQRRGEVAAHAFAERELAHGRVQVVANAEDFVEALHARVEIALRHVVDRGAAA